MIDLLIDCAESFVVVHGLSLVAVLRLLSSCGVQASLVMEHRLNSAGSVAVAHGFSCPTGLWDLPRFRD